MRKIFISACESSGDLHGANLVRALREADPSLSFYGIAGPAMRDLGVTAIIPMEEFQVMGFTAVLASFPKIMRQALTLRSMLLQNPPDLALFIDYPGLHLWLAKSLTRRYIPFPLVQYISPTVWAWKSKRLRVMEESLTHLLYIYPFETPCLLKSTLNSTFVGHPILDTLIDTPTPSQYLPQGQRILALFPGSRASEWNANLLLQLQAATHWLKNKNDESDKWIIAINAVEGADDVITDRVAQFTSAQKELFPYEIVLIPPQGQLELFHRADYAIAKSGTITLQLACYGIPTVVTYQVSKTNYILGKYLFKIKLNYFCIVNILLGQEVFPEFIRNKPTPTNISQALNRLQQTFDKKDSRHMLSDMVRIALKNPQGISPSVRAAQELLSILDSFSLDTKTRNAL
jgi:lipid-A-disaccharide synthase